MTEEELARLTDAKADANRRKDGAYPLHWAIIDTLNLSKKTLWRGKPMARLRERLAIEMLSRIADLECDLAAGKPVEEQVLSERQMLKHLIGSRNSPRSFLKQIDLFLDVSVPPSTQVNQATPNATSAIRE